MATANDSRIAAALSELDELEAFVRSWHRSSKQGLTEQYLHFAAAIAAMKTGTSDEYKNQLLTPSVPSTPTPESSTTTTILVPPVLSTPTSATAAVSAKPTPTAATVAARVLNKDAPIFRPLFNTGAATTATTSTSSSATASKQTSSVGFHWESLLPASGLTTHLSAAATPNASDSTTKSGATASKGGDHAPDPLSSGQGSFTVEGGAPSAATTGVRSAIMRSASNLSSGPPAVTPSTVSQSNKFVDNGADYDSFLDDYMASGVNRNASTNPFAPSSASFNASHVNNTSNNVIGKPSASPSVLETSLLNMSDSSSTAMGLGSGVGGAAGGASSSNGALGGTRSSAVLTAPSSPNNAETLGSASVAAVNTQGSVNSIAASTGTSCQVLVEFKRKRVLQFESKEFVTAGEFVVVGGDRGEDIGVVTHVWATGTAEPTGAWSGGIGIGKVLRPATLLEISQLQGVQFELESRAVEVAQEKVVEHQLPMRIVDAEYQFDRKKLTFYYQSNHRLDFRNLVRDLYKTFRARIWMEQD